MTIGDPSIDALELVEVCKSHDSKPERTWYGAELRASVAVGLFVLWLGDFQSNYIVQMSQSPRLLRIAYRCAHICENAGLQQCYTEKDGASLRTH